MAKYLRLFESLEEYENSELYYPSVSYIKGINLTEGGIRYDEEESNSPTVVD